MDAWSLLPAALRPVLGATPPEGAFRVLLAWVILGILFAVCASLIRGVLTSRPRGGGGSRFVLDLLRFLVLLTSTLVLLTLVLLVFALAVGSSAFVAAKWGSLRSGGAGPLSGHFDWNWFSHVYLAVTVGHLLLLTWRFCREVTESKMADAAPSWVARTYFRRWWGKWHAVWIVFVLGGFNTSAIVLETKQGVPAEHLWIWAAVGLVHGPALYLTPWLIGVGRSAVLNLVRLPGRVRRRNRVWAAERRQERWLAERGLDWPVEPWKLYLREPAMMRRPVRHIVIQDGRGAFEATTYCGRSRVDLRIEDPDRARPELCLDCRIADRVDWIDLIRRRHTRPPMVAPPQPKPVAPLRSSEVTITIPPVAVPAPMRLSAQPADLAGASEPGRMETTTEPIAEVSSPGVAAEAAQVGKRRVVVGRLLAKLRKLDDDEPIGRV